MTRIIVHTWYMALRHLRYLARQPWYIAFSLAQPVIYLLLFGSLFRRVVELPGFDTSSYYTFLTPGIVVMSALFGAGWSGISMISDLDRGILDRFLVSPIWHGALIGGRLVYVAAETLIRSLIIIGIGLLVGASFAGGLIGVLVLLVAAVLLSAAFAALSNAVALVLRKEESIIGVVNLILLPLTFLSTVFMAESLMPGWMQAITRVNPVEWAAQAGRAAIGANADWSLAAPELGYLLALTVVCAWLATRAFSTYQRSV